jgi:hypothetical protein
MRASRTTLISREHSGADGPSPLAHPRTNAQVSMLRPVIVLARLFQTGQSERMISFSMSGPTIVHSGETLQMPLQNLVSQCDLFRSKPALLSTPYHVRSSVPLAIFRDFVAALAGTPPEITNENIDELSLVCSEVGFQSLSAKLTKFRASPAFRSVQMTQDSQARLRITALEERWLQRDREIAELRSRISVLEAGILLLKKDQSTLATKTAVDHISSAVDDLRQKTET